MLSNSCDDAFFIMGERVAHVKVPHEGRSIASNVAYLLHNPLIVVLVYDDDALSNLGDNVAPFIGRKLPNVDR